MGLLRAYDETKLRGDEEGEIGAFECGFDSYIIARAPFSLRYFLLAVYFLIFDIEVVLLFPLILLDIREGLQIVIFLVLIILLLGLIHEWREGSLDWVNFLKFIS